MKAFFFDFTVSDGGATQGTVYLLQRLSKYINVEALDAYGYSADYASRIRAASIPYYIMHPSAKNKVIGYANNKCMRFLSLVWQLKDFLIIVSVLRRYIKINRPDIALINNEKSLVIVLLASLFLPLKVVLYYRGEGLSGQVSSRFIFFIKYFVSWVIVHSRVASSNLVKIGVPISRISYVPNCIEFFSPIEGSTGLPEKKMFRVILPAARPVLEKGHLTALKAIVVLRERNLDVELLFPGVPPYGTSDKFVDILNQFIADNELSDRVHFIGWRENLASDMQQCDLVVLPSHTEGFPRSIIEAMLLGVPVCATPVGGIPEAIFDGKTGLLFPVDDHIALANCIGDLMLDSKRINELALAAKGFANSHFSPLANTEGVLSVFNRVISSRP